MSNNLIAVAMSGGVDSSTAAALLREQGHQVIGLTMQLWNQRRFPELEASSAARRTCCTPGDVYDARYIAEKLGIPYFLVNLEKYFEDQVIRPFIEEYLRGRTPLPCALCNTQVKFRQLLELAAAHGASQLATGHYARRRQDPATGRWLLLKGADAAKDQSYFLFGLTQEQMQRILFPLGELTKEQVRRHAARLGLSVASKNESQEICFVPGGDYAAFIEAWLREQNLAPPPASGEIVTREGRVLGRHSGTYRYTVGQRKGLGVAVGVPLYVLATEPSSGRVIVGDHEQLLRRSFAARGLNWFPWERPPASFRAKVKIRNKHEAATATVTPVGDDRVEVVFDQPQRAVTPGQAAVFYDGDIVLGGGWIE